MAMVARHRPFLPFRLNDSIFLSIVCICIALNIFQFRLVSHTTTNNNRDEIAHASPLPGKRANSAGRSASPTYHQRKEATSLRTATYYNCSYSNQSFRLPTVPQFLIVGAQKSGTTAIYEFLKQHPQIQGSIAPETHFFDWHFPKGPEARKKFLEMNNLKNNISKEELQCATRKVYADSFFIDSRIVAQDTMYVEKTPSYLFLPDTPERISTTCFWKPKVIVVLRNPIDRAFSHYKMKILVKGRSFDTIIDEEMKSLHTVGLSQAPLRMEQNFTLEDPRFDALPQLSSEEQKEKHWKHYRKMFTTNYLQRGMYIMQLQHWMDYFELQQSLYVINYEQFQANPKEVYDDLLIFMGLPPFLPNFTYHNVAKYRSRHPLYKTTRQYLAAVFRPYNRLLVDQLGEEWNGVWDE